MHSFLARRAAEERVLWFLRRLMASGNFFVQSFCFLFKILSCNRGCKRWKKKLQKEKMQVAKTTIIIFFVCFFEGLSAQTLVGSFQRTNDFDVGVGITFNSDSTFTETTYQHMGGKLIAKGYFSLEGDTLNLHYEAVTANQDIQIKKERMERNSGADTIFSLSAEIKMQNKDGTPKPGPTLVLQNKQ